MVNRAIAQAHNENRHQLIPYQRAISIVTPALAAISWIPQQAREQLIRDVTTYITSTGGNSIRELTRYIGDQLSGFDGTTLQAAQEQIVTVSRQIAAQAQQAGVRARERLAEMVNEEFNTDERRRHIRWDEEGNQITTTEGGGTHTRFTGKSFRNLPWKEHKPLKNRKQMKLLQNQC